MGIGNKDGKKNGLKWKLALKSGQKWKLVTKSGQKYKLDINWQRKVGRKIGI